MSRLNKSLYQIDRQGHLKFPLRAALTKKRAQNDSGWEHPAASVAIMAVCAVLDFVMFKQLFSAFLYDSVVVQMLSIIAMLIGFDLASVYLGIVLKKRQQGLNSSIIVAVFLGVAFIIALAGNVALRIAVKDLVLPDLSAATTSIFGQIEETDTSNELALLYAIFASVMPVITSLVSFGVSFQSAGPLTKRMQRLQGEQVAIEDAIVEIEAILMEYESDPDHFTRLLEEDEQKYQNMLEMLHEKTVLYCDYVRERIKEHLGDPTSNNALSQDNREELLTALVRREESYYEIND